MGGRINGGVGHTFQPPCLCRKDEGCRGRDQGNRGGGNGRVGKEMFIFGTCHSPIGNDLTETNSSLSHPVFPPPIAPHSRPSFLCPLLSAPLSFRCWQGYKRYASPTIPMPLSIRSPPFCAGCLTFPLHLPLPRCALAFPRPSPFAQGEGGTGMGQ